MENNNTSTKFQNDNNSPENIEVNNNAIEKFNNIKTTNGQVTITNQNELKNNLFPIERYMRYFIYIIELLCLFNFDQGAISASTKEIKSFFKMTDRELGSFGGISFFGTTIGGIISLSLINKIKRRHLILLFLACNIISIYFPTIISSKIILILFRVIAGFGQSFMSIYISVWVDQFGIYKKKSIMMSHSST